MYYCTSSAGQVHVVFLGTFLSLVDVDFIFEDLHVYTFTYI